MSENGKPAVVLVDDEDMILTSIRTLLMLETDYVVEAFTDPRMPSAIWRTTPSTWLSRIT